MDLFKKKKALIKVGYLCNNSCTFCWTDRFGDKVKVNLTTQEILRKVDLAQSIGVNTLVLTGGEPTIRKDIFKICRHIKEKGFSLGIGTNGRMLSCEGMLDRLTKDGLEFLHISFLSDSKQTHNKITRTESFEQTTKGIKKAISVGLTPIINLVVQKENMDYLKETADLLIGVGVKAIRLSLVEPAGKARKNMDVLPELALASKKMVEMMEHGKSRGIYVGFDGLPLCLVKDKNLFIDLQRMGILYISEAFESEFYPVDHKNRIKLDLCEGCKIMECPGIYKGYSEILGKEELNEILKELANTKFINKENSIN